MRGLVQVCVNITIMRAVKRLSAGGEAGKGSTHTGTHTGTHTDTHTHTHNYTHTHTTTTTTTRRCNASSHTVFTHINRSASKSARQNAPQAHGCIAASQHSAKQREGVNINRTIKVVGAANSGGLGGWADNIPAPHELRPELQHGKQHSNTQT
jgi:hypothetical protein